MDPFYEALSLYKRRRFEECKDLCTEILKNDAHNEPVWVLKMKALTEQVYTDEIDDDEGLADTFMDTEITAVAPRPGTSLRHVPTAASGSTIGPGIRPRTSTGRPITGVSRPLSHSQPASIEMALKTPRSSRTSRPVTSRPVTGRAGVTSARPITAMVSDPDGPFIQVSRLNLAKLARGKCAKFLFEWLFYHERDVTHALELAAEATQVYKFEDWHWKLQLSRCYMALQLVRDAEKQLRSALRHHASIELVLKLAKVQVRLDQPLLAIDTCTRALEIFPSDVSLLTFAARLHEGVSNALTSCDLYRQVLRQDAINVEAAACVAVHHFYNDQPEVALRLYRRLLQMGVVNASILNNLALCCYYVHQYDTSLALFTRALQLADEEELTSVWFNLSHIAIGAGDVNLSRVCLRMSASTCGEGGNGAALNNLGVIELRRGAVAAAKAFFQASARLSPYLYEPLYNLASLANECGDLQTSFLVIQRALKIYPEHVPSQILFQSLKAYFNAI